MRAGKDLYSRSRNVPFISEFLLTQPEHIHHEILIHLAVIIIRSRMADDDDQTFSSTAHRDIAVLTECLQRLLHLIGCVVHALLFERVLYSVKPLAIFTNLPAVLLGSA